MLCVQLLCLVANLVRAEFDTELRRPSIIGAQPHSVNKKYGPWIVHMKKEHLYKHEAFGDAARRIHESYIMDEEHKEAIDIGFEVMHSFKIGINAVVVRGVTEEELAALDGVERVMIDGTKYIMGEYNWGTGL